MSLKQLIRSLVGCGDYDDLKSQIDELHKLAHFDALTSLANRHLFDGESEIMISRCNERKQPLALFLIDLDNFKYINDTHGHLAGNFVLQRIAKRLQSIANARTALAYYSERILEDKNNSLVARLGGDEFVLIFENMDKDEASIVAQQIIQELKEPIQYNNFEITASASIGVSISPWDGNSIQTLLKMSDLAMYAAKELGRDRFKFYRQSMGHRLERRAEMEHAVRDILDNEDVLLFYQPIVCSKTEKIVGVEALLRGKRQSDMFFDPNDLIEIAEDTNLIIPLGTLILTTACKFARKCIDTIGDSCASAFVSVNVSVTQLVDPNFVDLVKQILEDTSLRPSNLVIEVTESMLMVDYTHCAATLRDLKKLGVSISIDDFGKGYSSFSYLQNLPIDKIKIDTSFVRGIGNDNKANEVIKGIILMADALGMLTCAEGVETHLQFEKLKEYGCKHVQGYYKYRPLAADTLLSILTNNS